MKSLIITVLMFLTLSVGTKVQENQKVFTAEEQAIVELSNNKWNWMSEKNVNSWHSHKAGQLLIATAGIGYYQEKGQPARRLFPGDIVEIAPDVVHWHGAAPDSWFAHIAITTNPQINAAVWLDPVNDEQYSKATSESENRYAETNKVLTGREQAIVTIASYTGKGDLEHLKPALTEALEAGMTINEITPEKESKY